MKSIFFFLPDLLSQIHWIMEKKWIYTILFRIQWNCCLLFFSEKVIFREIMRNDMLWYAFTSGKCISLKHILNYRFACSSIIRVVSIASSLQLFAPMYVYNDGGTRRKKRMSIERQEFLHLHISLVSNIHIRWILWWNLLKIVFLVN